MPEENLTPPAQTLSKERAINSKNVIIGTLVGSLIVGLIVAGYLYLYYFSSNVTKNQTKVSTFSAKPVTKNASPSSKKDDISNWESLVLGDLSFKYPKGWGEKYLW